MTLTVIERAIATFAVRDDEWAALVRFMPVKEGKAGSETDWRHVVDCLIPKCNVRNCSWSKIPHGSTIRMAFYRSIDFGTWMEIERALPSLNLSRAHMFKAICIAARQMRVGRR